VQRSLVAFVLAAIVLVMYAPIVLGGKTWDDVRYHTDVAPPRIAAADAVLHGELPLWWEGTALGVPLLAEPSHGAAYPVGWIAATPRALDLFLVVHVLWCALGVAVLARRRGASELGAVVAGALIATSGVITSAALRGVLPAIAHLPWLAICATTMATAKTRTMRARHAIATAALVAMIGLAGQYPVLIQAGLVCAVSVPFSRTRWAVLAWAAGFLIAMPQWISALLAAAQLAGTSATPVSIARPNDLVIPRSTDAGWFPVLYIGAPLIGFGALGRPSRRFALLGIALLVAAFIAPLGDAHVAGFAIITAAHAGTGFDRVTEWFGKKLLLVVAALGLTAAALPMLFATADRAMVDEPPVWARAAITPNEATPRGFVPLPPGPPRLFRPVMGLDERTDDDLGDALATFAGTSAAKWGIASARSDDPARPRIHDQVWLFAAGAGGSLLERYGVSLAILPASMASGERGPRVLGTRGRWALVRVPASPPAAVVYEWMFVEDVVDALARMFPPGAASGLSSGVVVLFGSGAQNQDEPRRAEPCTIARWSGGTIELRCTAERAAYHVVSSTAIDGWSVELDGVATAWQLADVMRRAVALPAGEHRVTWRYWPPGLTVGLVLAALGTIGLVALWQVYGRDTDARDRPADPPRPDAN
jgi:hypothetical protein